MRIRYRPINFLIELEKEFNSYAYVSLQSCGSGLRLAGSDPILRKIGSESDLMKLHPVEIWVWNWENRFKKSENFIYSYFEKTMEISKEDSIWILVLRLKLEPDPTLWKSRIRIRNPAFPRARLWIEMKREQTKQSWRSYKKKTELIDSEIRENRDRRKKQRLAKIDFVL